MSVESYGVERYTGGMHVLSVRPVLARVGNAAVDVSDRRNPETSSRIMIARACAQSPSCGCMIVAAHVCDFFALHTAAPHR